MPNTNQILFIVIIVIIFSLSLIGVFYFMNKSSMKRRELFDLEQRLQMQEQIHIKYLLETKEQQQEPVMIKQGLSTVPSPIIIMKPHKEQPPKTKRESILNKVYGFRHTSNSPPPPPNSIQRPSAIRPPSFLPMQEKRLMSPPAYGDYRNSTPILIDHKQ